MERAKSIRSIEKKIEDSKERISKLEKRLNAEKKLLSELMV